MAGLIKKVLQISVLAAVIPTFAFGVQAPNPRGGNVSVARNVEADSNSSVRRSATSVIARTTSVNSRKNRPVVTARSNASRAAVNNKTVNLSRSARASDKVVSNKSGISRSAKKSVSLSRSASNPGSKKISSGGFARAASSRATAVFNDISKIGGGYGSCRDAYATCMDQFCANANDTYRRCYCSDRFTEFRDTADALDTALKMLADFQDNNLNAVDKTAAEVNAMYSASAGEAAIKKDTSASQQLLDSIGDVLSGRKKTEAPKQTMASLGVLDLSGFSSGSSGDIWGDNGGDSLFGGGRDNGVDMTSLEGKELYTQANNQCSEIIREACKGDALYNMAKSAYSIMITQDCNAYQKNIDAKKTSVEETVRTAEKYLREARLEEYRAHNSQDVNDCLNKVEAAMLQPTACGDNYSRCLDYSGLYINPTTAEPIYSKALFGLNNLIVLDGSSDIIGANKPFNEFLEEKKVFANQALDGCRDLADTVWTEFKRMAIIRIAQAQDEKIEEVKSSCVSIMKDCYDEQSGALADFAGDGTAGSSTGALTAITTHDMCVDKVMACAALYGDPDGCEYHDDTKKIEAKPNKQCGLKSLLSFVNTVDSVNVAEGCEKSIKEYAQDLCKPASDDTTHSYPWGCRLWTKDQLKEDLTKRATLFCGGDLIGDNTDSSQGINKDIVDTEGTITKVVNEVTELLEGALGAECEALEGLWVTNDLQSSMMSSVMKSTDNIVTAFYANVFNGDKNTTLGVCAENTAMAQCMNQNTSDHEYATYDANTMTCKFTEEWYQNKCASIGGFYINAVCRVPKDN